LWRYLEATDGSFEDRRYLVLSGGESNGVVVVRSCRFAHFYVAMGATTRSSNVFIHVEAGTPPIVKEKATMGPTRRSVNPKD
jgi:hypothetical protein